MANVLEVRHPNCDNLILVVSFVANTKPKGFSDEYHVIGWCIYALSVAPLPVWALWVIASQPESSLWRKIVSASRPLAEWGPENLALKKKYDDFIDDYQRSGTRNAFQRFLFGREKTYSVNI